MDPTGIVQQRVSRIPWIAMLNSPAIECGKWFGSYALWGSGSGRCEKSFMRVRGG